MGVVNDWSAVVLFHQARAGSFALRGRSYGSSNEIAELAPHTALRRAGGLCQLVVLASVPARS